MIKIEIVWNSTSKIFQIHVSSQNGKQKRNEKVMQYNATSPFSSLSNRQNPAAIKHKHQRGNKINHSPSPYMKNLLQERTRVHASIYMEPTENSCPAVWFTSRRSTNFSFQAIRRNIQMVKVVFRLHREKGEATVVSSLPHLFSRSVKRLLVVTHRQKH